jgi:hypothetical protein|tara:strand:+ start:997 stop:1275 length:279 start_codon:yes stop_codon:yes gene_type:complete
MFKTPQEWADALKSLAPQVNVNKNGYEIRTELLGMAKDQIWQDYHATFAGYETSIKKDGAEVVTTVEMPEVPGAEAVIAAAEKFYNFVNQKK